jgi:hypothetical protein
MKKEAAHQSDARSNQSDTRNVEAFFHDVSQRLVESLVLGGINSVRRHNCARLGNKYA